MLIAARHSDLARLQAYRVGDAIKAVAANVQIEFAFRASLGDVNLSDPLWKMPEKGVFTEDFLEDLKSGKCDMVVHSWKDLPTEERNETEIVATLPRADIRDVLLIRKDRWQRVCASRQLKLFSSSPRRIYNLKEFLKSHLPTEISEVEFESVRGNIPTRVRKLLSLDVDGLVLAKAALDRLLGAPEVEFKEVQEELRNSLKQCLWMVLPLSVNPAAAAQGALAIEIRRDRSDLYELLKKINCQRTFEAVVREREILKSFGGGCHQKIGISRLHRSYGDIEILRGLTDSQLKLDRMNLWRPQEAWRTTPEAMWPPLEMDKALKFTASMAPLGSSGEEESSDDQAFSRQELPSGRLQAANEARFLWVARANAWPSDWKPTFDQIVWAAGVKTWLKLAQQGVWVHGSAESLGESEEAQIEMLLGEPVRWLKLSHSEGNGELQTLVTYKLVNKEWNPNFNGKTHFFWKSGSLFKRALKMYPEIANAKHACGPGNTYEIICRELGRGEQVRVYLSLESWRAELLNSKSEIDVS